MRQSPSRANHLLFRVISWIGLLLLPLVCSCARLQRHVAVAAYDHSQTLVPNEARLAARINLNTASAIELEQLPGVGKVLAERIVAHREQYGAFRRVEHLMMVRGFSEHKCSAVRDLVTVNKSGSSLTAPVSLLYTRQVQFNDSWKGRLRSWENAVNCIP